MRFWLTSSWLAFLLAAGSCQSAERVRLFLIGDSTLADKPLADNPERGWGQLLPVFFDDRVQIKNHAVNGRSTKSFIDEKRWDAVLQQLRKDDWVFIQFGHNDEKSEDPTRYAAPQTDYRANLARFVSETRGKGAHPVLLTPVMRRRFDAAGKFFDTHGEYPGVVRALAKELNVPLIDLHQASQKLIEQHGVEGSKQLFLWIEPGRYKTLPEGKQDDTHFSEYGATQMAGLVVAELRALKLDIAKYLKPANVQVNR
jgi:DNA sulfur modification protein DndE